ncbi:TIGR02221 family CRISPR-associated protein [Sulfuricystis multivorans]|uniref:TIGR02221 family CRISPR-associated protein n=1 Tax=Sulfuricystis multivorans TaxID=2211108 RepID=UPI000F82206B|nr:TIGR02221 family CRISPR-associated protein [Sulfuricystis multivorans]
MATLISFLGKSQLDSKTGYRTARYRMPDGSEHETAYFGLALADHLGAERVIVLGTASSMWDMLVENVAGDDAAEELRLELFDAVRAGTVTQGLLDALSPAMTASLGRPVQGLLIPSCVTFAEQEEVLTRLADHLGRQEQVALDLTHGFRHLAMLGFAAARYLAHEREVKVAGLYYGALDMTQGGITPVVTLDGLAHLQEWAEAFEAYEASGDFSRFAPLLIRDDFPQQAAEALTRAWHFLVLTNVKDAAKSLSSALKALEAPLAGASWLFRARLQKALRWCHAKTLSEKFRLLALQSLERGDVLRASIFGLESFLAREVEAEGANPLDFNARKAADERFQGEAREGGHADWKRNAYWLLKNVRNACAHGTPPSHEPHAKLMRNPERLRRELEATLSRLTNTP